MCTFIAMRKIISGIILLSCLLLGAGCSFNSDKSSFDIAVIKTYRDIPGITDQEITAIEALKSSRKYFSYGAILSADTFILPSGTYAGFSPLFCDLLSGIFGIPFVLEIHSWEFLKNGIDNGTINFSGDFTPTLERKRHYYMSHPIAEHSLGVFTYGESVKIESELDLNNLKIGFFEDTVTDQLVMNAYPKLEFEAEFIKDDEIVEALEKGRIDAFIIDSPKAYDYVDRPRIHSHEVLPLAYTPVSLATIMPELEPIISVMNKYIDAGGIDKLYDLYKEGGEEYEKYFFRMSLSMEETAYLDNLHAKGSKVPVALEYDNYPMSFYNETDSEFQGIAVDVLTEISRLSGIKFYVATGKNTSWGTILAMLTSGEVSLVSELLYSEERKDNFLWSDRYASSRYALLSKTGYPDLKTYQVIRTTVGVGSQSAYEEMYNFWFPGNSNLKYYDSQDEALSALDIGEIDLLMASENVLLTMRNYREKPGYKVNIRFNSPLEESYFGFNKNEEVLCSIFRKAQQNINIGRIQEDWTARIFDYS
ncbi:MAG: transporter substrate-binding domain-containing protein, partial [Treponema sp.]|nr:transporter substrate-binding domain-containing protein [Treponema sp.]